MNITDISSLETPDILETLDYEEILARMKDDLVARDPEFIHLLESDPAMKVMEVAAWRELLIRQRVNDAARANLLAFAGSNDLEHLAAFYGVERLENEGDEALRRRIQEKIIGWSTAGSRAHYRFHALSADVRVRDARADSPELGRVRVAVLSTEGDGLPSAELLQIVTDTVTADDIRVLTDTVDVVACDILPVDVIVDIYIYHDTQEQIIETIRQSFIKDFDESRGLGWDLTRSWIISHLFLDGVQRVELTSPTENIIADENACVALNSLTINLAGRDR
tara:strand:- start:1412 stop:2251 length:840 start_codon:yes stop_codon:yes gene_type:complete